MQEFTSHPGRKWLDQFLWSQTVKENPDSLTNACEQQYGKGKFIDCFRFFHPFQQNAFTCWSTVTGARQTNYGTRIDYIFANKELVTQEFVDCKVLQHVEGSDHCPVRATLSCTSVPATRCPSLCAKNKFIGKQQKMVEFLSRAKAPAHVQSYSNENISRANNNGACTGRYRLSNVNAVTKRSNKDTNKPSKRAKQDSGQQSTLTSFLQIKSGEFLANPPYQCNDKTQKSTLDSLQITETNFHDLLHAGNVHCSKESVENMHDSQDVACNPCNSEHQTPTSGIPQDKSLDPSDSFPISSLSEVIKSAAEQQASRWKTLLSGPPPPPLCRGHKEPCVLRTVKKAGPNLNRTFYVCARPEGHKTNKEARCDHFQWVSKVNKHKSVRS